MAIVFGLQSWLIKFKRVNDFENIWKIFVEARKYFWNWANIRFEAAKVPILGKLGRRLRNIENILEFSSYLNASPSIIYMNVPEMPSRVEFRKCKSTTECTLLHAFTALG